MRSLKAKSVISGFVIATILSTDVKAGVEDQARLDIANRQVYAKAIAAQLVANDFNQVLGEVFEKLNLDSSRMEAVSKDIESQKRNLLRSLEQFSSLSNDEIRQKKTSIRELHERFERLNRERYRLSWRSLDSAVFLTEVEPVLTNALVKLEAICSIGRSDENIDIRINASSLYHPNAGVHLSFSSGLPVGGALEEAPARSSGRSEALKVGATALVAFGGYASATGIGVVVGAFAFAGAAILNFTNHFVNSGENNEFMGELNRAAQIRFSGWQRDDDYVKYYRESCNEHLGVLAETKREISVLNQNNEKTVSLRSKYAAMLAPMRVFEVKLERLKTAQVRWMMRGELAKGRILNSSDIQKYGFIKSQKQEQSDLEELRQLSQEVDRNSLVKFAVWKSVEVYEAGRQKIEREKANMSSRDLAEAETKAFRRLLEFTDLFEEVKLAHVTDKEFASLIKDDAVREQTLKVRSQLISMCALGIRYAFDSSNEVKWNRSRDAFRADIEDLVRTQAYRSEIREIERAFDQLVRVVEGK